MRHVLVFIALLALQFACSVHAAPERPNIIVILADDMGYSDLGCTGAEIQTPNLDRMAREGVLFTHFYNTSKCCPSRAALLTGQYQWDAGMGHMNTTQSPFPEYQQALRADTPTIAELLRETGYQTFMSGKWHVGDAREHWPDKRGFDKFYGTPNGGGLYFYPSMHHDRPIYHNGELVTPDTPWYSTDAFTDAAIDYIQNRRDETRPFFMYLAYIAPHFPLQAKQTDIDKYRETYKAGYAAIREARFEKQKRLGIVPEGFPFSEPVHPDWASVKDQKEEALKMAVYAAQMDCLDQNIGHLMSALDGEGIKDNTVVLFLSDNGGGQTNFNKTPDVPIGHPESNAAYGNWYNVSNTPYRQGKSQEHEGGIITPMVMHWPAGIPRPGCMIYRAAHIMDILPACLEWAGTTYPNEFNGKTTNPIDGRSFLPLLRDAATSSERVFYWEHTGNRAVRKGDWKLAALRNQAWQLYNLASDPYEENDLAATHPEKRTELLKLYESWAAEHGVRPWPLKK